MTEAEVIFRETFYSSTSRFGIINSFRELARLGLSSAASKYFEKCMFIAYDLLNNPDNETLFLDKEKFYKETGGTIGLTRKFLENHVKNFNSIVDMTSLVFAHSILDNAAFGFCKATALACPADWEVFIKHKQFSLDEFKEHTYDDLLFEKLTYYLQNFEKESMLKKIDRLFQICKPPKDYSPITDYSFDRVRLENLDSIRHEAVHGSGPIPVMPEGDGDILYFMQTSAFLMSLVNYQYDLKLC